jgi:hypothetical protein
VTETPPPTPAAVLVPLFRDDEGELRLVLVVRGALGRHGHQLSLPGGKHEPATLRCSRPRCARRRKRSGLHARRSRLSRRSHRSTPAPPASASTPTLPGYVDQGAGDLRRARSPRSSHLACGRLPTRPCAANSCSPCRVGPSRVVSSASNSTTDTGSGGSPYGSSSPSFRRYCAARSQSGTSIQPVSSLFAPQSPGNRSAVPRRIGRPGIERLWSRAVATGGNRWQMRRPRKRSNRRKPLPWFATSAPPKL